MCTSFQALFDILGVREFLPNSALIDVLGDKACPAPGIKEVCGNIIFLIAGFDEKNLNLVTQVTFMYLNHLSLNIQTRLPVYISHNPAGTSVKNVVHWAQVCRTCI